MTNILSASPMGSAQGLAPLRAKWGWIVALGVVYLIAGFVALYSIVIATLASAWVVGIMMMIAGVAEIINAFQIKTWGRFIFWLILGVLYIVAGFIAFENPLLTAIWVTLILGAALVASGIVRVFLGFNMKAGSPWIWVVVSGLITLLLGVIILAHWPISGFYTLGIFLGVDLVFAGASWIGLGFGLKNAA
ncbi:MAG TPA: HdeD family acid-resistance protein [Roseiarcus sp.]|nr:HdeD family acid-resistance protein [Roseiarcus sp.]